MNTPAAIGFDIGSRSGKVVVIDRDGAFLHSAMVETVGNALRTFDDLRAALPSGLFPALPSIATGYGRTALEGRVTRTATEITCHALGALRRLPGVATVIDIGGQDAKIIAIEEGRVRDFAMNDKCAAGAGRFLEVMAPRLGLTLEEFARLDVAKIEPLPLSATCTVFAESEIVSLMASGADPVVLAASVAAMAARMAALLAAPLHARSPFFMTGGVSRIAPVRNHLALILGHPVETSDDATLCGAHGAALLALKGG